MIDKNQLKPIVKADEKTCRILSSYIAAHNFADLCEIIPSGESTQFITIENQPYKKPVRFGEIIDILKAASSKTIPTLSFYGGILNMMSGLFTDNNTLSSVRLTEKEIAILEFLHNNKGNLVSRKDLLGAVWQYAENAETHTLETHIYRLRQKIESDPSNPQTLLTQDNGYMVQ